MAEFFLAKTVNKLRKETPKRLQDLRTICDEVFASLSDAKFSIAPNSFDAELRAAAVLTYLRLFQHACGSRQPRLIEIGLEGVNYLIEYGFFVFQVQSSFGSPGSPKSGLNSTSSSISNSNPDLSESVDTGNAATSTANPNQNHIDKYIELIGKFSDNEYDDVIQLQVIRTLLSAVNSTLCEVHEASLFVAVRTCFQIHLMSNNSVNKNTAKAALTQMLSVINQRMEIHDLALKGSRRDSSSETTVSAGGPGPESAAGGDAAAAVLNENENTAYPSIFHKDSASIFRALCKLSNKDKSLNDELGVALDPIALQNKILSLELIHHCLQFCGPAFKSGEKFIYIVRNFLCVSLLSNCTSQVAIVTGLSLQIFVLLLEHFKDHLKSELEVFITGIFLRILESENSSYDHKLKVLEVFHSICRDASGLVEIFATFDCDMEAIDLFKRIVDGFSKVAKSSYNKDPNHSYSGKRISSDELKVRGMGIDGLVIILNSLLQVGGLLYMDKTAAILEDKTAVEAKDRGDNDDESEFSNESEALNAVDVFDRKQRINMEIETGILKFNASAKKGLQYLVNLGHITMTPESVAKFLLQFQDRLDKTAVGEYLGREREYENGFCLNVLHSYADNIDFTGVSFDISIRQFLAGFRIPGEAQKIDRIMEKFAERYCIQNPDVFVTADLAFILAFSIIMLQTNLHNPAIKDDKRMTKEQFLKQNKGLSPDGEIPEKMLMEIYDRIAAEPITIKDDEKVVKSKKKEEAAGFAVFQISPDRRKKDAFNDERKEMVKSGEALIKQLTKKQVSYTKKIISNEQLYVRPMFDVVWAPILGVLSQLIEVVDDPTLVSTCLNGFQYGIRLACRLDVPIARDTYVNSLIKFSTLDIVREMQQKNVECIKTLLVVAISERDYFDESWTQVMRCLSQLSRLQMYADGKHTDDKFFSDKKKVVEESSGFFDKFFSGPTRAEIARDVEAANSDLVTREISPDVIDQIFLNSQYLSEESVLHFVLSLCGISADEINTSSAMNSYRHREGVADAATPRIFSLQKLVEVADFNMQCRPRIAWQNMWKLLADHFTKVGTQDNAALAMYAVDSLKQLSIKFLQKEELSNFNFQRLFLKPFEVIMVKSKSSQIKDLVLNCIEVMIRACASNIRSGWKSIFAIFEGAAQSDYNIANIAFGNIERLMGSQFDVLVSDFVELVNCLVVFLTSKHTDLATKSLDHILLCSSRLAEGRIEAVASKFLQKGHVNDSHLSSGGKDHATAHVGEDAATFRLWWPLLLGLSTSVSDYRPQIKTKALETLHTVLKMYGHLFSPQAWSVIFKGVIFPILDSAKSDDESNCVSAFPSENPVLKINNDSIAHAQAVLQVSEDLYFKYQDKSEDAKLLSDVLNMLEGCICADSELLAKMGLKSFHNLLIRLGQSTTKKISTENLDLVCKKLSSCLLSSFSLNFGDAGYLTYVDEIPPYVARIFKECPLSKRRRGREEKINQEFKDRSGDVVQTPYGEGRITHIVPSDGELEARYCVNLTNWGGKLYYPVSAEDLDLNSGEGNIPWADLVAPTMTSMVMALESIRVVSDAVAMYFNVFSISHINDILLALETLYWHARNFNACRPIREALFAKNFMQFPDDPTCLPHLLEQEVFSLSKVLDIVLNLYKISAGNSELMLFAESWVFRVITMTCTRYLNIEESLISSKNHFQLEQHEAYGAAVLISLHGILGFNQGQFNKFSPTFLDNLAKLTLCDDFDVRKCVGQILMKHVNPLFRSIVIAIQETGQ